MDGDAPQWPDEAAESAFLSERRENGETFPSVPAVSAARSENVETEEPNVSLPPLQDLIDRIPGPTLEVLDELFRARFVSVKRVPKATLK